MNEKDKKSLIIISSVFVFTLVFMVFFTFYRRDAMLSDRTVPKINTNTVVPEIDPPALGDTCAYSCPYGSVVGNNQCCSSGYSYDGSIGTCVLGSDRTQTSSPTSATYSCSSCSAGKYLRNSQCYNCPNPNVYCPGGTESYIDLPQNSTRTEDASGYLCNAGYFADGTGCTECPAGKYRDEKGGVGLSSCATCKSNYYSEAGATSCTKCVNGSSSNSNKTACICDNDGEWIPSTNTCEEGIIDCGVGYYYNGNTNNCERCPSGKYCIGGVAQPQTCPAGMYAGSGASDCSQCNGVTEYSSAGAERCSTCSGVVDSGHTTCTPCPTNSTVATNHKSCVCTSGTWDASTNTCIEESCSITTIETIASSVSLTTDGTNDPNSFYTVYVTVDGCVGKTINYSTTNHTVSPTSQVVSNGITRYSFRVYPNQCGTSSATASITGVGSKEISTDITIFEDWVKVEDDACYGYGTTPVGFTMADAGNYLDYYTNWGECTKTGNNGQKLYGYREHWHRDGCGTPGNTTSSTPDDPPEPSNPTYCFIKKGNGTDNQYCEGTESYCSNLGFTDKIDSTNCKESKACYLRTSDNTYVVGKFSGQSGYTYYGTTCPVKKCYIKRASSGNKYKEAYENPGSGWEEYSGTCSEEKACYLRESDNSYVTGMFNDRDGYTKVDDSYCQGNKCYINRTGDENEYIESSTNPGEGWEEYSGTCGEDEACYLKESDNTYVIGKYKDKSGYTYYGTSCPVSKCYVSESGEYVWGDYSNDSSYTLVPEITDKTNCGYTPDVPQTSMDVKTIVYIAVAIMSVVGLYFVVKYNNESKNI